MNKFLRHTFYCIYNHFFNQANTINSLYFQKFIINFAVKGRKLMWPTSKIYLIRIIVGCIIFFYSTSLFSQELLEQKRIFEKGEQSVFSDPDESIKVGIYFLKNKYKPASLCHLMQAESFNTKGNYNKALEHVFEAGSAKIPETDSLKISVLLLKAKIIGNLGLNGIATNYLDEAENILKKTNEDHIKEDLYTTLLLERVWSNQRLNRYDYSLSLLKGAKQFGAVFKTNSFLAHGIASLKKGEYVISEMNLNNSLQEYSKSKVPNTLLKIQIYTNLAKLYLFKKQYNLSIDTLKIALGEAKRIGNSDLIREIDDLIATNYFELGNKEDYTKYNTEMMTLWVQLNSSDVEAINLLYKLIEKEKGNQYKSREAEHSVFLLVLMIVLVLSILGGVALYVSTKRKERHFIEIQNFLEFRNRLTHSKPVKTDTLKKIVVPTETEQAVLEKLKKFELTEEYINKDMSLAMLASKVDVNTKYLSEIINKHYQDNFNTYINKLRINYIIKKLENDSQYSLYKISYLAEACGFSSHTSFTNVFKSITGISPRVFIRFLEDNKKTGKKRGIGNYCIVILCFLYFNVSGQTTKEVVSVTKNLNPYKNPDEAIRIGDSLYNDTRNPVLVRVNGLSLASDGYASKREYKKALDKVLIANELLKNSDNKVQQIRTLTAIAMKFQQLKVYDKAIDYLDQAKEIIDKYPYKDSVRGSTAINYNVKGIIFKEQLSCDIAINYFNKAIEEYNKLKNKDYAASQISIIKYNIGNCYLQAYDYEPARKNFNEALKYAEMANANSLKAFALKGMALVYTGQGDYKSSINNLKEAMNVSEEVEDVVLNMAIYNALSNNYWSLGDWRSHRVYNRKYLEAQEKLTSSEREAVSNSVDELLKNENKKLTDLNRDFYYKVSILGLLMLIVVIVVFFYYKRQNKIINKLQEKINSAK